MNRQVDVAALHSALDSKRRAEKLSWRELAGQLDLSPSVFTRMAQGRRPELDTFAVLTGWLGMSAEDFIDGDRPSEDEARETVTVISTYLRADKALKPESAQAIEEIVRTAYEQLAER
jgi:transcriptional regulator with XRE-family HTH domain